MQNKPARRIGSFSAEENLYVETLTKYALITEPGINTNKTCFARSNPSGTKGMLKMAGIGVVT